MTVIDIVKSDAVFRALRGRLADGGGQVAADGLWGSSAPLVAGLLAGERKTSLLYLVAHQDQADNAQDDIEIFCGRCPELLPAWEGLPGQGAAADEIAAERVAVLNRLQEASSGEPAWLIASVQALMQPMPTPDALEANTLTVRIGQVRPPAEVAAWLTDRGYERLDLVESPGDFALRGGILDVYPPGDVDPVRIEFFGDCIESIRLFDISTQRSTHTVSSIRLAGLVHRQSPVDQQATTHLAAYLPADALVVIDEPLDVAELADTLMRRLDDPVGMYPFAAVLRSFEPFAQLHLGRFASAAEREVFHFDVQSVQRFEGRGIEAVTELCETAATHDVYVYCDNPAERQRLEEMIAEHHGALPARLHRPLGFVHRGFEWRSGSLIVIGHHEIFGRYERRRRLRKAAAARPIDTWLDLEVGDYVVHMLHGIARFRGIRTISRGTDAPDVPAGDEFLSLEFAGGANLHVPVSQIDLVQKYIGTQRARPQLSKLGGVRWKNTKERVAEAVQDLASDLLRIQAERRTRPGVAFPEDTTWQREFESSFVYPETEDQIAALEHVKRDQLVERPMDRLLCGDVGYGKTELAVRAAFKVVEYGKQAALLVPTTVLAEQHHQTFRERLADYPFNIACLSRFRTRSEQEQIIRGCKRGQIDVVIGTHRLLSSDVGFADLGLVIIDEEQRFGVEHKERLKRLRATVDVLTMTATPIPRTLHMSMLGVRDISTLATPPLDRRAVVTSVCHWDSELIRQAIIRELNRDGQAFFVHNRVQSIGAVAERLKSIVPEARIVIGHGQMPEHQLEEMMTRFVRHDADVLVCTTIIESGIDIPNANTIFINNAERFGLADLHQLRGRVGRYKHRAYCYLLLDPKKPITESAGRRLKAIEEFSELGAGFRIAMRDLEIRGAGNLLGPEQSGHIAAVGYELYCHLLESSVKQLRGEAIEPERPVHLDLQIAASVPRSYIRSDRQRMEVYRRMARCSTPGELEQLEEDIKDAFGPYPPAVGTLLGMAEIRARSRPWRIRSIIVRPPDVVFAIEDLRHVEPLFEQASGSVRWPDPQTLHWRLPKAYFDNSTLVPVLCRLLRKEPAQVPASC